MQVDPIKPTLKASGIKLFKKTKYDEPLSNVAFKFNLRRYIVGSAEFSVPLVKDTINGQARVHLTVPSWCTARPTQVEFGIRATFWVDMRRGRGRVGSASRSESYGQKGPPI